MIPHFTELSQRLANYGYPKNWVKKPAASGKAYRYRERGLSASRTGPINFTNEACRFRERGGSPHDDAFLHAAHASRPTISPIQHASRAVNLSGFFP